MGRCAAAGWGWEVGGHGGERLAHDGQVVQQGVQGMVVEGTHDGGDDLLDLGQQAVQDGLPGGGEVDQNAAAVGRVGVALDVALALEGVRPAGSGSLTGRQPSSGRARRDG